MAGAVTPARVTVWFAMFFVEDRTMLARNRQVGSAPVFKAVPRHMHDFRKDRASLKLAVDVRVVTGDWSVPLRVILA